MTIWSHSLAQPSPCMGQNVIVIEGISGVSDEDSVNIISYQIRYKDPRYPKIMDRLPVWSECVQGDSLNSENLYLYPSNNQNCSSNVVKDPTKSKYYLLGHDLYNGVLTIAVGSRKMFIVFPDLNRNRSNVFLSSIAYKHLTETNYKNDNRHFYSPSLYLPSIEFKPGVFFLNDYSSSQSFKKYNSSEIAEFHKLIKSSEVSPEEYWNEEILFYMPYGTEFQYSRHYEGNFSESEAIETIVKNSTNYSHKILDHVHWQKYTQDETLANGDLELKKLLFEMRRSHEKELDGLFSRLNNGDISEEEFLNHCDSLNDHDLQFLLENDFELALSFCGYLLEDKDSIDDFKGLIQNNKSTLSNELLQIFFEQKQVQE